MEKEELKRLIGPIAEVTDAFVRLKEVTERVTRTLDLLVNAAISEVEVPEDFLERYAAVADEGHTAIVEANELIEAWIEKDGPDGTGNR